MTNPKSGTRWPPPAPPRAVASPSARVAEVTGIIQSASRSSGGHGGRMTAAPTGRGRGLAPAADTPALLTFAALAAADLAAGVEDARAVADGRVAVPLPALVVFFDSGRVEAHAPAMDTRAPCGSAH